MNIRIIQLIILLLYAESNPSIAQELGYINDKDGYTNLRLKPSRNSEIIGIITTGQEFTFYPNNATDWWKVDFKYRTGFMHKSRIDNLKKIKSNISRFFSECYKTDRNNVELIEINNEKLFSLLQEYPSAASDAFCEQEKKVQKFLISEYESPIHDLIDLQLLYSRLISINSPCSDVPKIKEALKKATGKLGIELKNYNAFVDQIPDYNRPDKHPTTSNKSFISNLSGKWGKNYILS